MQGGVTFVFLALYCMSIIIFVHTKMSFKFYFLMIVNFKKGNQDKKGILHIFPTVLHAFNFNGFLNYYCQTFSDFHTIRDFDYT